MSAAVAERVDWLTAPPLWSADATAVAFDRPALLRFAGDDFMEQYNQRVGDGRQLDGAIAAHETWRSPSAGASTASDATPVKLFQPAHGRFYLVAAGLVCGRYGLPDKAIGGTDRVGFVLRRLVPTGTAAVDPGQPSTYLEQGWVVSGDREAWVPAAADGLAAGEEPLGLFPTTTTLGGHRRRVLAGVIPTGARERYESAPAMAAAPVGLPGAGPTSAPSAADVLAEGDVIVAGLQSLLLAATSGTPSLVALRHGLYFLLLDLDAWLDRLPGLRTGMAARLGAADSFRPGPPGTALSWLEAADAAVANLPSVADLDPEAEPPAPAGGLTSNEIRAALVGAGISAVGAGGRRLQPNETLLHQAMSPAVAASAAPSAPSGPAASRAGRHVYVTRCFFERPECRPSHRLVVSRPSRPFVLAGFHDPDAPARPVIIPTPIDVSVQGLRKFPKTVSIAMSKQLKSQVDRVRSVKLGDLDDGNIPAAPPSLGMICSLSIPIITICALILLMIIVQLLNIVFFWVPWFQICRPKDA